MNNNGVTFGPRYPLILREALTAPDTQGPQHGLVSVSIANAAHHGVIARINYFV